MAVLLLPVLLVCIAADPPAVFSFLVVFPNKACGPEAALS
jgi:hypothetical protein